MSGPLSSRIRGEVEQGLLQKICYVTLGLDWGDGGAGADLATRAQFFDNLIKFQRFLAGRGRPAVTRQAIRLWQSGAATPRRLSAVDFLHQYLLWSKRHADNNSSWPSDRMAMFDNLNNVLLDALADEEDIGSGVSTTRLASLDPIVLTAMQGLFAVSSRSNASESAAFFRGSKSDEEADQSYYLLYRYSTNNGEILKSFLVIRKPERGKRNIHIFNHFIWGGSDPNHMSHIFRECEGFIIKLEKSFYFVGYNYTIPADKRQDPETYKRVRESARWTPNGMGVIAVEYDDAHARPGLIGGVTMTLAGMSQPVVGRLAMLHLGTKQSLGRIITDSIIVPGELRPDEMASDLRSTVKRLRDFGCRRMGALAENYAAAETWDVAGSQDLARIILDMIDNIPAWEGELAKKTGKGQRVSSARGALETPGRNRPRD